MRKEKTTRLEGILHTKPGQFLKQLHSRNLFQRLTQFLVLIFTWHHKHPLSTLWVSPLQKQTFSIDGNSEPKAALTLSNASGAQCRPSSCHKLGLTQQPSLTGGCSAPHVTTELQLSVLSLRHTEMGFVCCLWGSPEHQHLPFSLLPLWVQLFTAQQQRREKGGTSHQ